MSPGKQKQIQNQTPSRCTWSIYFRIDWRKKSSRQLTPLRTTLCGPTPAAAAEVALFARDLVQLLRHGLVRLREDADEILRDAELVRREESVPREDPPESLKTLEARKTRYKKLYQAP